MTSAPFDSAELLKRLVDHVVSQTEDIRTRLRELEDSLGALSNQGGGPAIPQPHGATATNRQKVYHAPTTADETAASSNSDGARLKAIEMALSGSSRAETGVCLSHDFRVADPSAILDDVFGPGTPPTARMPWAG